MANDCTEIANRFNYVKSKLSLKKIVEDNSVELKESGIYFKGQCPFCQSPNSFTMNQDKEIFYCFTCHVSGDVIFFIAKLKNISQLDSVKYLEEKYLKEDKSYKIRPRYQKIRLVYDHCVNPAECDERWQVFFKKEFEADKLLQAIFNQFDKVFLNFNENVMYAELPKEFKFFSELLYNTMPIWSIQLSDEFKINWLIIKLSDNTEYCFDLRNLTNGEE